MNGSDERFTVTASPDTAPRRFADGFQGRWWVLHTRSRNEKSLASELQRLDIDHYLPLVRSERRHGGRRVTVDLPLFPGYVFMCGDAEDRYVALRTNRVAHVIDVEDQERLRFDLDQVHRVIESDQPVDLYPGLQEGRRCRVKSGPLRGLEGVVVRRQGTARIFIEAAVLGQSAVIEIDNAVLETID
jgi:transcription antitermination factor NusG